ncbi:K(+)-transporting ATPase subunit F [Corynebacterium uropygiale]|uniref:K(+)-transporting ATPase subunit F n=1 Tax=Corynebacterium uropygiale TaxID=1775911 RepID=A0A9X1TYV6_9CORY|nr:K(+)-transporting ATPase subunit F [Corynebacterium uropygiale]MCF4007730.1 K(+)-transporting ATPase subunit F [Corynebacterium uropygiale]
MSQIVAIGLLVIAIALACYLVIALVDPERF